MSTHKHIDFICWIVLAAAIVVTILFMNGEALGIRLVIDEDAEANSDSAYFTKADLNGTWDRDTATVIVLSDSGNTISGKGVYEYAKEVVIASDGYYEISGTLSDGMLVIDAEDTAKVHILLNGVSITCADNAALNVSNADKVFLTLAQGTENVFVSGADYSSEALSDGADGAVFAHDDLTINGTGTLIVSAGYKHGISANDDLVITGGTITVSAPAGDAIRANDSIRITNASLDLTAGDEGISAAGEGGYLYVESGTFVIDASDDGVNTIGQITIAGGDFTITAGDDAMHSDTALVWENGTLLVKSCYEGLEAPQVTILDGDLTINCTDDGINASDGSGSTQNAMGGMGGDRMQTPGGEMLSTSYTQASDLSQSGTATGIYVLISGGVTRICNSTGQDADCIDSNGDIHITGGKVIVSVVNNSGNNAFDYASESGGVCEVSGGTVIGCCNSSMAESFTSGSAQSSITFGVPATADNSAIIVKNASGETLLEETVPYGFSAAILSIPEFTVGESYTVTLDGTDYEVTLSDTLTTVGSAASGGMGANAGGMGGDQMPQTSSSDGSMPTPPSGGAPGRS